MESRNIEKALEISAKLAAGETVSEQGTNAALYQEYSTNPEVYDMVLLSLKKMELSVYEYNNSLFAAPKAHGSLFGYSNEALRRELGLRTNGELYLAILSSIILLWSFIRIPSVQRMPNLSAWKTLSARWTIQRQALWIRKTALF